MNEKELKELKDRLKDSAENPVIVMPSYDGSDDEDFENDVFITPKESKLLIEYITQLETNRDEAILLIKKKTKVIPLEEGGGLELSDYDIQEILSILERGKE